MIMNVLRDRFSLVGSCFGSFFIVALLLLSGQSGFVSLTSTSFSEIGSNPSTTLADARTEQGGSLSTIDHPQAYTNIPPVQDFTASSETPEYDVWSTYSELRICPQMGDTSDRTRRSGSSSRGETKEFIVSEGYTITAELKQTGDHCYLYVEEGYLFFSQDIVREFDERIFPELSTKIGTPGDIDRDPRIYILYYNMGNNGIAGYFHPYDPNGLDLLYLNLYYDPGEKVISHELTHQIQNNYDRAEERWIDEGLAEMCKMHLYGSPRTNSFMKHFENLNGISLNWKAYSEYREINFAQYGIAYVFQQYIYDQFQGLDSSGLVLRDGYSFDPEENEKYQGIEGINNFFNLTGANNNFNSFFCNWTVANLLDNPQIGEGTWGYASMDISVHPTVSVENGTHKGSREIRGYAPCYIHVNRTVRPTVVMIEAGDDMSLAILSRSNESAGSDMVDIIELAPGENEFVIDTNDPKWKHITLDIINHKDIKDTVSFELSELPLKPPVAVAGENLTVTEGENIFFNASASHHPDEIEIVRYQWDFQDDGIFDSEGLVVNHTYYEPGDYTVVLKISDEAGNEATDTLEVTVLKENNPPEIEVWLSERQPLIFKNVIIDASNSTDPDSDSMNFNWDFGENGNSDDIGSSVGVFFSIPGRNTVILNVSDGRGMFTVIEIVIYVRDNTFPVAVGPGDMVVNQNESFMLEDGGSFDVDGHFLTYEWSDGERTEHGKLVSWEFTSRGRFSLTLLVRDELGGTDTDRFYVKVNSAPLIKIDHPGEIKIREKVVLDARGTRDPEGDRLEYSWAVGGTELAGEKANRLEYVFRELGPTSVTLTVSDSNGAQSLQELFLTVIEPPQLKKINIIVPQDNKIFTDKIGINGDNGGNEELDAVYIVVDNGRQRGAIDSSGVGDWSSWEYSLDVRKMSLGPHTIKVYGILGDLESPDAVITVYVEEAVKEKVPERHMDDQSSVGNEDMRTEKITYNYLVYALPAGALIFLLLIVVILLKRRRDHRKEMKRLLEELLL